MTDKEHPLHSADRCSCLSKDFRLWFSFRDSYGDEYFAPIYPECCPLCNRKFVKMSKASLKDEK